jgi:hypothetical protein
MRKISFYFMLTFIIISCDNKEDVSSKNQALIKPTQTYIINGDIKYTSEITDGSKPKKPIFIYDIPEEIKNAPLQKIVSKTSEQSVTINFNYGIADKTNSGCTIDKYNQSSGSYTTTDAGVYGYNPAPQDNGYLVRGYGLPHHNYYYNSLVLITRNRPKQTISSGQIINSNDSKGSAISIEYQFKANVTYEISLRTYFNDNGVTADFVPSNGFPTVFVQLKDSPIISDNKDIACDDNQIVRITESNPNYVKSYTLENNIKQQKILTFNFSTTESKQALLIAINPKRSEEVGINAKIPSNSYTVSLRSLMITEKPFDPSIIIPIPPGRR